MQLHEIQQKLKAPKSQFNAFGKYNYRNAEDILEAVKPLLGKSVLTLTDEVVALGHPSEIKDANGNVVESGIRFYVKATATFIEHAETFKEQRATEPFVVSAYARESFDKKGMDAAQITGAASSYARKYALNGLFLIDDTKDADSDEQPHTAPPSRQEPRGTEKAATHGKDPAKELLAAKDRTKTLLGMLGHKDLKTKKDYEDKVFDLTGYILADKDIEVINEKLAALVEKKDANE